VLFFQGKDSFWFLDEKGGKIRGQQGIPVPNPDIVNDSLALQHAINLLNNDSVALALAGIIYCTHGFLPRDAMHPRY